MSSNGADGGGFYSLLLSPYAPIPMLSLPFAFGLLRGYKKGMRSTAASDIVPTSSLIGNGKMLGLKRLKKARKPKPPSPSSVQMKTNSVDAAMSNAASVKMAARALAYGTFLSVGTFGACCFAFCSYNDVRSVEDLSGVLYGLGRRVGSKLDMFNGRLREQVRRDEEDIRGMDQGEEITYWKRRIYKEEGAGAANEKVQAEG